MEHFLRSSNKFFRKKRRKRLRLNIKPEYKVCQIQLNSINRSDYWVNVEKNPTQKTNQNMCNRNKLLQTLALSGRALCIQSLYKICICLPVNMYTRDLIWKIRCRCTPKCRWEKVSHKGSQYVCWIWNGSWCLTNDTIWFAKSACILLMVCMVA